jgi:Flp pilus assembly protein TadG
MKRLRNNCRRRGFTLVYGSMSITVLLGFVAFCVDISRVRTAKSELQAASDAAALNGANGLVDATYFAKAAAVATENLCDGTAITLAAADVTPGNWTNSTFTANGSPRNAIRVVAARTKAAHNVVTTPFANALGLPSPDLRATSIVAIVNQSDYEWVGTDGVNLSGGSSSFKVTAFDATNPLAAESRTTVRSNGSVTISGASTINADIKYGTTANVDGASTVTGNITQYLNTLTYPPGSQVANLNGVTPVYSTTYDLTVNTNQTLPGGVYVVKNVNVANCNITFTGPVTIVCTGNLNMNTVGFTTLSNLPANLKIISTTPGTSFNITNLTKTMYADFYMPDTTFSLTAPAGYYGMRGRGVFKNMNVSGNNASLWYDRSLTNTSQSRRAILVR